MNHDTDFVHIGTLCRVRRGRQALLAATVAALGGATAGPRVAAGNTYTYQGPGTAAQPLTGNWSPNASWAEGTAPASNASNVLSFGGSAGGSAYTSTDDITGALGLNALVLNSADAANIETIAAGTGNSLTFNGSAPALTQNGLGAFNISAPIALSTAATFNGSGSGTVTISGIISGAAGIGLTVANTGGATLVLIGANAYTGPTTIAAAATLQLGNGTNAGTLYTGVSGAIADNGTLAFNRGTGTITQGGSFSSAPITGSGNLTMAGTGILLLNVAESYTGVTTIGGGSVQLLSAGALSPAGTIVDNATLAFNRSSAVVQGTDFSAAAITGTGGITLLGSGTVTLNAANTYAGRTLLNAGTVNVAATETPGVSGPLGSNNSAGAISFAGGTLQYSAADTADYSARFSTAAGQLYSVDTNGQTVTFATGLTSSTGSLAKLGAGTLILTGGSTFSGTTTISAGTLQVGNGPTGNLAAGPIVDNGALVFSRTNRITQSGGSFGLISGTGSVTVSAATGGGLVSLSLNNAYTGGTTINAGTLQANTIGSGNSSTGTTGVTVNTGGVLAGGTAGAQGQIAGPVTINTGGKITAGTGAAITDGVTSLALGNLSTGVQTWNGGGGYVAKVSTDGTTNDQLVMTGLSLTGSNSSSPFTVTLTGVGGASAPTTLSTTPIVIAIDKATNVGVFQSAINGLSLVLSRSSVTVPTGYGAQLSEVDTGGTEQLVAAAVATPEPTSLVLILTAGGALLLGQRRRRRSSAPAV